MERVLGIGGYFFRAKDPKALAAWYQANLGITADPAGRPWEQEAGMTVFAPFPADTDYFGRKDVGAFLQEILTPGASVDWKKLLKDKTGSELSAQAMVRYFEPLMAWLKEQNQGRKATLSEL